MKNYTNRLARLLLFSLSLATFFACTNGTQKLGMNNEEQKTTRLHNLSKSNEPKYLSGDDIKSFLEGYGDTKIFRSYLKGEKLSAEESWSILSNDPTYRKYCEAKLENNPVFAEGVEPIKEAYSLERINFIDDYLHNRLEIKSVRREKNMNELRLGLDPILLSLIKYVERSIGEIDEKELKSNFTDALDALLAKGVDINQTDASMNTPVFMATSGASEFIKNGTLIDSSIDFYSHQASVLEYILNHLLEKGADPTKKTDLGNNAELCIENFCGTFPNNVDMKRVFDTIKTYAAKFKTSESKTSETKTDQIKTNEETKEGRSI